MAKRDAIPVDVMQGRAAQAKRRGLAGGSGSECATLARRIAGMQVLPTIIPGRSLSDVVKSLSVLGNRRGDVEQETA